MRSDWDDAPDYLRNKKSPGPRRMLTILGVVSALTCGAIALFAEPIVIDVDQLKKAIRFGETPVRSAGGLVAGRSEQVATVMQPASQLTSGSDLIRHKYEVQSLANQSNAQQARQTSFNDANYAPRTDINTLQAPEPIRYASSSSSRSDAKKLPKNNQSRWTWTGADRKKQSIVIHWMTVNGWIEFGTVCHNHQRGSIIFRDCRKAAKEYFMHRCRTENLRAFCLAENRYYP